MASYYVVIKNEQELPAIFPMRQWVRQNLEQLPSGIDFSTNPNTHSVRDFLRRHGWIIKSAGDEVYVIQPDADNSIDYAIDAIDTIQDDEDRNETVINEAIKNTFSLERDLQSALRLDITSLESGLTIIDGGSERNTSIGRIDITARDKEGTIVVIELKAGDARPDVIAQILSYMQAITEETKEEVRGIIVARSFHDKTRMAARQIKNLKLTAYSFQFDYQIID